MKFLNQNKWIASLIHQTKPGVTYFQIKQDNVCLYDLIHRGLSMPIAKCIVNATLGSDEVLPSADGHLGNSS